MKVFKIAFRKGQYSVSIPDYPGGDVVEYETAKALADELAAERAKVIVLREALRYYACKTAKGGLIARKALDETKPNEPTIKRIN